MKTTVLIAKPVTGVHNVSITVQTNATDVQMKDNAQTVRFD